MSPWEPLLDVQALDTVVRQLDHRDAQLPERALLAEIDEELVAIEHDTRKAEEAKHELVRGQKRIEDEVATLEAKIEHEESQLYGGGSSDPSLLQSLQDEIASLRRRVSVLEDDELELMEQVEPLDEQLEDLAERRTSLDERAVEATKRLAESETEIAAERDAALARRAELVAGIPDDAIRRYEQVRDRLGGTAVARLEGGVCGACHIKLSAVEHDRIQHLPADAEVECEECGRFLVRA